MFSFLLLVAFLLHLFVCCVILYFFCSIYYPHFLFICSFCLSSSFFCFSFLSASFFCWSSIFQRCVLYSYVTVFFIPSAVCHFVYSSVCLLLSFFLSFLRSFFLSFTISVFLSLFFLFFCVLPSFLCTFSSLFLSSFFPIVNVFYYAMLFSSLSLSLLLIIYIYLFPSSFKSIHEKS